MANRESASWLTKVYGTALLVIFGFIVLHAPLSVWLGTTFGYELAIKSWKEILLLALVPAAVYLLWQNKPVAKRLIQDKLLWLVAAYALLHVVLFAVFRPEWVSGLAGLAIDLRYLLFFVLVYIAVGLQPSLKKRFISVGLVGAAVVLAFSLLQIFVLPKDALSAIGYSKDTIAPYLTIDQDQDYVRINGTLRGPNPLGAYMVIILAAISAYVLRYKPTLKRLALLAGLLAAPAMVLGVSHSRSAWLAAAFSVALVGCIALWRNKAWRRWLTTGIAALVVVAGVLFASFKDTAFVQTTVLHVSPESSVESKSNQQHLYSLAVGTDRMLRQPFGDGPGSTGSASLFSDQPLIIENQYLFVAHESGWLGLGLFIAILAVLFRRLWQRRGDPLTLGVFAAGLGLALIGLLQPVWADDTVSLVWWGMAAVLLAQSGKIKES